MQTNNKLQELINKFNTNKNVTEEDITLLKSIATDLKISQKRVGLNYDHSQLDQEDASNLMQGNKLFFQNKRDLNISFNEKGMTNNALIEGDNFYALSKMKDMGKRFNVIYIDPPYNTGNDDLGYEDKRIGSDDGFKHSKWLAFMEPRLKLAHQLLTDDGVIFVSIDDHEQAYLKVMMDKIFGERNFISNFIWHNRNPNTGIVSTDTEYVLLYSKNIKSITPIYKKENGNWNGTAIDRKYINPDNDNRGLWRSGGHTKTLDKSPYAYSINLKTGETTNEIFKNYPYYYNNLFSYAPKSMTQLFKDNRIYFEIKGNNVVNFKVKKFKNEEEQFTTPQNMITKNFANTNEGKKELNNLNITSFSYPKPVKLIKFFINMIANKNATVLDFFAGTGTTGQAVLELNKEDGGHRQFTLVTSKEREDNIARTITYKRLSKVINGYTTPKGKEVAGIHANLSYYLGDIDQLVLEDEVDFGMVDDAVINEDKASTYAIKENAVLIKKFNDSAFLFKNKDKKYTLIGEGLQDNLELEKYLEIDDELVIYDLGLDSQLIHQIEDNFKVKSVINLEDSRLPKYLDIEL